MKLASACSGRGIRTSMSTANLRRIRGNVDHRVLGLVSGFHPTYTRGTRPEALSETLKLALRTFYLGQIRRI